MGKSAVSSMMTEKLRVPVLDSDAVVHELYSPGGDAVEPVAALFPGVVDPDGGISRPELGKFVLGPDNEAAMAALEAVVHPLVDAARWKFLHDAEAAGETLVVLDIPLLYEKGYENTVDAVCVVSAGSVETQCRRVLARPGMTPEKFEAIAARQVPGRDEAIDGGFRDRHGVLAGGDGGGGGKVGDGAEGDGRGEGGGLEPDESRAAGVTRRGRLATRVLLDGSNIKETVLASYNGSVHATKNVFVCCARM